MQKINEINERIQEFGILLEKIEFEPGENVRGRTKFSFAEFSNHRQLSKKEFGKFFRLLKSNSQAAALFVLDEQQFFEFQKKRKSDSCRIGGFANKGISRKGHPSWNKGLSGTGICKAWNKGLTMDTDPRCNNISIAKRGSKNPMFGKSVSEETRQKLSISLKAAIAEGRFTPNVHNSRTRKQLKYNGILFRSSWEALFHQAFPDMRYEMLRIPYIGKDDKSHTYITDFYDISSNTIYEIKPQKYIKLKSEILSKINEWCNENNKKFKIIDEFKLVEIIPEHSVIFNFDERTNKLIKGLYASIKKRRNTET